ncbi:195_t:CDS:2 [Paraglomus brasilianum]|uniref:195_t:CDS:1 n=1 Tax=Paraglomus brasilianum TaxID=144538 RepID=A0A9N9A4R9_9GLOM|nr:195_t:CDS:2 [Paraglomus brasilianum]
MSTTLSNNTILPPLAHLNLNPYTLSIERKQFNAHCQQQPMSLTERHSQTFVSQMYTPQLHQETLPRMLPTRLNNSQGSEEKVWNCTECEKSYKGRNARSILRRHLKDKHAVDVPRGTRWDNDPNRPKSDAERRERMLLSKRRWAQKARAKKNSLKQSTETDGKIHVSTNATDNVPIKHFPTVLPSPTHTNKTSTTDSSPTRFQSSFPTQGCPPTPEMPQTPEMQITDYFPPSPSLCSPILDNRHIKHRCSSDSIDNMYSPNANEAQSSEDENESSIFNSHFRNCGGQSPMTFTDKKSSILYNGQHTLPSFASLSLMSAISGGCLPQPRMVNERMFRTYEPSSPARYAYSMQIPERARMMASVS